MKRGVAQKAHMMRKARAVRRTPAASVFPARYYAPWTPAEQRLAATLTELEAWLAAIGEAEAGQIGDGCVCPLTRFLEQRWNNGLPVIVEEGRVSRAQVSRRSWQQGECRLPPRITRWYRTLDRIALRTGWDVCTPISGRQALAVLCDLDRVVEHQRPWEWGEGSDDATVQTAYHA